MSHNQLADQMCDWLYEQETRATDDMLFIYGYIIPQVTLAELNFDGASEEFTIWLCQQVRDCALKDKLSEQDFVSLEQVLTQMTEVVA